MAKRYGQVIWEGVSRKYMKHVKKQCFIVKLRRTKSILCIFIYRSTIVLSSTMFEPVRRGVMVKHWPRKLGDGGSIPAGGGIFSYVFVYLRIISHYLILYVLTFCVQNSTYNNVFFCFCHLDSYEIRANWRALKIYRCCDNKWARRWIQWKWSPNPPNPWTRIWTRMSVQRI